MDRDPRNNGLIMTDPLVSVAGRLLGHPGLPCNVLTLFVDMALVDALVWTEHGLSAAHVQVDEEMGAVVTEPQRNVMCLEKI